MLVHLSCARNAKFLVVRSKNMQMNSTVAYRLFHLIERGSVLSKLIRERHAEKLGTTLSTYCVCVWLFVRQNMIANVFKIFKLNSKVAHWISCPWESVVHKSKTVSFHILPEFIHSFLHIAFKKKKDMEKRREIQGIQGNITEGSCIVVKDWYAQKWRIVEWSKPNLNIAFQLPGNSRRVIRDIVKTGSSTV